MCSFVVHRVLLLRSSLKGCLQKWTLNVSQVHGDSYHVHESLQTLAFFFVFPVKSTVILDRCVIALPKTNKKTLPNPNSEVPSTGGQTSNFEAER